MVATKENGLIMVVLREVMVVICLITLKVELMLSLSVRFVKKWVIQHPIAFKGTIVLLLKDLYWNVKSVVKDDTQLWNVYHMGNYTYQGLPPPLSLNAMVAHQTSQIHLNDSWIVNTGASHHSLTQVQPFKGFNKITIGNGTELLVKNIGYLLT